MEVQFSVYVVPLALAAALSAVLAVAVARNLHKRTAPQIFGVLLATLIWSSADALRLVTVDPGLKMLWHNVRFLGSTLVVLVVLLHALEYTGREEWITRETVAGIASVFVATNLLVWTDDPLGHDLIYAGYELVETGSVLVVDVTFGPWFYLNAAYSYVLLVVALALYVAEFSRRSGTYRRQTGGLIVALLVPWTMNGVYLAGYSPIDLTSFGLMVTAVAFVAQLYWLQLLDVVPVARSKVVHHMESGYLVVDPDDRVLDANDASAEMLDLDREGMIGSPIEELFGDYPELLETLEGARDLREDVAVERGTSRGIYEVDVSPVYDGRDQYIGRVVLLRDVTERRRRQRQLEARTEALERQNEKLDRFASIVSHDLRNPITVAKGNLELAREDGSPERLDRVADAVDRMEEITEDVLALARHERDDTEVGPVDLAGLARQSWETVETGDATLEVATSRTIAADESRLRQALENLFRNAVEHGSTSPASRARENAVEHAGGTDGDGGPTVRVGDLPGGFFVEDDGPGIDPEDRDAVFESGFTTEDGGTGFGLTIVAATADAHGWTVSAVEGSEGGARFEFVGVETVDDRTDRPDRTDQTDRTDRTDPTAAGTTPD